MHSFFYFVLDIGSILLFIDASSEFVKVTNNNKLTDANKVKEYGLGQSMSKRGNCWDNAPQESFFGHMKDEVDFKSCTTFEEARALVDDYMDYYNNHRSQWNMKKLTPAQYTNQLLSA